MTLFLQVSGAVLLAIIIVLALKNNAKDVASILSIAVCAMVALAAMHYLEPVLDFLRILESMGGLKRDMTKILLKSTGIGILSELAFLICKDAGNESIGKSMQILGTSVILYLSIPMFSTLIELLQRILGEL